MPRAKSKWLPKRRGWTAGAVAHYIGMSEMWFCDHRDNLIKKHGFPSPSPLTGRYDGKAVGFWYDEHSGILKKAVINNPADGWRDGLTALAKEHGDTPAH